MEFPSLLYLITAIPRCLYRLAQSLLGILAVIGLLLLLTLASIANPLFAMLHKSQAVKASVWKRVLDIAFCKVLFIRPKEWRKLEQFIRDNEMTMKTSLEKFNEADKRVACLLGIGNQSWRRRIIQASVLSIKINHLILDMQYIRKSHRAQKK